MAHTHASDYAVYGDASGTDELLVYHYHPEGDVHAPHLHVNADVAWAPKGLRKKHLPTGRVAIEDVVQLLIEDLGVAPRRRGWLKQLDRNREVFASRKNW